MQDFIDQAAKNGVNLLDKGPCQFCGAAYEHGIFDCINHYNHLSELIDFSDARYHMSRFLSVDAHALQHPEIHGRWSNHFHLTRLHLILDRKQPWYYKTSPMLSSYINTYKQSRKDEYLLVPPPLERGSLSSSVLTKAATADKSVELIHQWAMEVYMAWSANHTLVSHIADGFIDSLRAR